MSAAATSRSSLLVQSFLINVMAITQTQSSRRILCQAPRCLSVRHFHAAVYCRSIAGLGAYSCWRFRRMHALGLTDPDKFRSFLSPKGVTRGETACLFWRIVRILPARGAAWPTCQVGECGKLDWLALLENTTRLEGPDGDSGRRRFRHIKRSSDHRGHRSRAAGLQRGGVSSSTEEGRPGLCHAEPRGSHEGAC